MYIVEGMMRKLLSLFGILLLLGFTQVIRADEVVPAVAPMENPYPYRFFDPAKPSFTQETDVQTLADAAWAMSAIQNLYSPWFVVVTGYPCTTHPFFYGWTVTIKL